jgi:hypothetical protein
MQFPHSLFKQAGLNAADVASLCEVSRVTGHRWLKGVGRNGKPVGVNVFLRDRVTKLTARIERAVQAGALPCVTISDLPPAKRAAKLRSVTNKFRTAK